MSGGHAYVITTSGGEFFLFEDRMACATSGSLAVAKAKALARAERHARSVVTLLNPLLRDLFGESGESLFVLGSLAVGAAVGGYALFDLIRASVRSRRAGAMKGACSAAGARWVPVHVGAMTKTSPGRYRLEAEIDATNLALPPELRTEDAWAASVQAIMRELPGLSITYMGMDRFQGKTGTVGPLAFPRGAGLPVDWPAATSDAPLLRIELTTRYAGGNMTSLAGAVHVVRAWRCDAAASAPASTWRSVLDARGAATFLPQGRYRLTLPAAPGKTTSAEAADLGSHDFRVEAIYDRAPADWPTAGGDRDPTAWRFEGTFVGKAPVTWSPSPGFFAYAGAAPGSTGTTERALAPKRLSARAPA